MNLAAIQNVLEEAKEDLEFLFKDDENKDDNPILSRLKLACESLEKIRSTLSNL